MDSKSEVVAAQCAWAREAGLDLDKRGYLSSYTANLFQPMNSTTKASFDRGSGAELKDKANSPAKMRAIHSSSALAVNVFDYWAGEPNQPLLLALGLPDRSNAVVRFEAQFPTGLPGNPPNLDVVIEPADGPLIGIESKFTEWLARKSRGKRPFKEKYFPNEQGVWSAVNLPDSQHLAERMQQSEVAFHHLDAPQLLKHALGLATGLGNQFRLFYMYFDCAGVVGETHRNEIQQFRAYVGDELRFDALSYQDLIGRLLASESGAEKYRRYLRHRYLQGN